MFDWAQRFADWVVYEQLGLAEGEHLAEALNFFIYDCIKIILLLALVIFLMGLVNSYFPVKKIRDFLTGNKLYGTEYLMASAFGVVTPFCSCSSVPLFIGFVRGGIPLAVTFSFLITSPLVNEIAIGLFLGLFGVRVTAIYVISGVLLGMVAGMILSKFKLERLLTPWVHEVLAVKQQETDNEHIIKIAFKKRMAIVWREFIKILKGVLPYVIIGLAIGGIMHGYIPEGFFEKYMNRENLFAVPAATILAVPMYSNASGILPVVQVLVSKGIPLGTAIAFMMGVIGLSFPEAMLLKKVMTLKLIGIFFGVVTLCIITSGYIFNLIL